MLTLDLKVDLESIGRRLRGGRCGEPWEVWNFAFSQPLKFTLLFHKTDVDSLKTVLEVAFSSTKPVWSGGRRYFRLSC